MDHPFSILILVLATTIVALGLVAFGFIQGNVWRAQAAVDHGFLIHEGAFYSVEPRP